MATDGLEGWKRAAEDPLVLATLAINGVVALCYLVPILDRPNLEQLVEFWALVPISLLAALAPWIGLPRPAARAETVFWGLWSASMGVHLVVRVVYLVNPEVDYLVSGALAIDVLYVLFYLPLLFSLLFRPDRLQTEDVPRLVRVLETLGITAFAVGALAYFSITPRLLNRPEFETWVPSFLLYWIFDAFLFFGLLHLRASAGSESWKILYTWLLLAPACWVVTDMVELTFWLAWDHDTWPTGPQDIFWYFPWLAITLAGRMRVSPFPRWFGAPRTPPEAGELTRSLGPPGWLLAAALVLPTVHLGVEVLGLLDPLTERAREAVALATLFALVALSSSHHRLTQQRARDLLVRSRALEREREVLAGAVEQAVDPLFLTDRSGGVIYANRAARGPEPADDPVGRQLREVMDGRVPPPVLRSLERAMAQEEPWEGGTLPLSGGDEPGGVLLSLSPLRDRHGRLTHWMLVCRGLGSLRTLARDLIAARRVRELQQKATETSRELHRRLAEVHSLGEVLRRALSPASPHWDDLEHLLSASKRMADLTQGILSLAGGDEEQPAPLRFDRLVRECLAQLAVTLPENITLMERLGGREALVLGVSEKLKAAVQNILANAVEAMAEGGGTLEVKLEEAELDDTLSRRLGLSGGGSYVKLTVTDTGKGMDSATLERIFDPFFSTRRALGGIGLGLFLSRTSVQEHGGNIRASSRPGKGTSVEIYLPVWKGQG